MTQAIAIAAVREQSFAPALESAKNLLNKLIDLMYGTQDRVNMTFTFAIALGILGYALSMHDANALQSCMATGVY